MHRIRVHLKDRSYDILVGSGLIRDCGSLIKRLKVGRDAVVITNKHLASLYSKPLEDSLRKSGISVRFESIPDSEKAKAANIATNLINKISAYDTEKSIFIVAFGGGVTGDLAGFVAAVYKRGVPYIQIPTTLLAQVDSSIGGKVAIDLPLAKNLVGAFYQPKLVLSDTALLKSLSGRQVTSGLGEIIKYGVIKDQKLFSYLESNYGLMLNLNAKALEYVIARSSAIKAHFVEKDELDRKGIRAALNFGHTIGHAIEAASSYSGRYNHGEAVALGMIVACEIALKLKMLKSSDADRIRDLISKCGLPTKIKGLRLSDIYNAQLHDKKFVNCKNRFVLPAGIGKIRIVEAVPETIIKESIKKFLQ